MKVIPTSIPDVLIIEPKVFGDERGFFYESFNARTFREATGLDVQFIQDNHSKSAKNVLRGLHYQIQHPQGKLVRVIAGEVFDVAVDIRKSSPNLGVIGLILCALYLVWMLNLYNFMDGIDGIAGIEAITVTLTGAALSMWFVMPSSSACSAVVLLALLAAAAVLGFLVWNFPPAKIFMGDAGSGFLGILMGTLSLMAGLEVPALFWSWVILLGVFVVDATVTLFRRLARRQRLYEAHRSHAYQFAARCLGAHLPVSLMVGLINLCWLLPIAYFVATGGISGVVGVLIAYVPLVGLAWYLKAGAAELQSA